MEDMDIKLESERLKKGVELFNKRCDFVLSVASLKQLPPDDKIEVAFNKGIRAEKRLAFIRDLYKIAFNKTTDDYNDDED